MVQALRAAGYETIVSIGELTENDIGSNCGQYLSAYMKDGTALSQAYSFPVHEYTGA